ncbi:MAG TPA: hypothetical protein DCX25_00390 [Candidatus Pacebacteria bacterium]|nr:MAG: hypothetical protein UX00_C0003G0063 [Microgenomates group bacterium GW2011_GWB1_45_17]KKU24132.1 MAG: hypothetical protein UX36_C0002G0115 [Microgenomates group bacterium GW2011_GWC1_46_15]KKU24847.1 MAG: hypothetical protein UX35_C0001G0029 [Microgenomates group bacterium GW2011_GWA1_46_15]HAV14779.1 hypothetical protein [Candidatus Paceibacterota bacterium]HCR11170.1 hypothetical protein [Candidatus Paceibacterota bacterium]
MQPTKSLFFTGVLLLFGIFLAFTGLVLLSRIIGPLPFAITQTTTTKQSTFDVSGEGKVTTAPDKGVMSLGVTVNESTVKQAQDKANTIINAVTAALGKLGIEKKDIQTDNYSLYPNYDYQAGGQKITGYQVNATLTVSVTDFAKLNQAIDAATQAGANQVGGVSFTLTDDKKKDVEDQARKLAIDHAKEKAGSLAKLAGMRLGRIVNVVEQPASRPYPVLLKSAGGGLGGGPESKTTNIEPGSTTYQYTVTLSYETF